MRSRDGALSSALLVFVIACTEPTTAPRGERAVSSSVSGSVRSGEKLRRVVLATDSGAVAVGGALALSSRMYFSRGGELPGTPYVRWSSSDPCVAEVSAGVVRGVRGGSATIVARFAGLADTAHVTVAGDSTADPGCEARALAGATDESDGTPSLRFGARPGERLRRVVLFRAAGPLAAGDSVRLVSELWFSRGGRLSGAERVRFRSLDGAVACVGERSGWLRARGDGVARLVAEFAGRADTVEVHVGR